MTYSLDGHGIIRGRVYMPAQGAWTADVQIDTSEELDGAVQLVLPGGLSLTGTIKTGGVVAHRNTVQLVGGKGGLGKTAKGQHFYKAQAKTIIGYLLDQSGETLSSGADTTILSTQLQHWQHIEGTAGQGLDLLCAKLGCIWVVGPDGTIWIGNSDWPAYDPEHILIGEDPVEQVITVAVQDASVRPTMTFRGQKVQAVEHEIDGDRARQRVHYGAETGIEGVIRKLVQHTLPIGHLLPYEGIVEKQNSDGSLDMRASDPRIGPGWQSVPLCLQGTFAVKVLAGARAIVEFLNGDLSKPIVRQFIEATFTEAAMQATTTKIDGTTIEVGKSATKVGLGPGGNSVAARNVVAAGDTTVNVVNGTPAAITGVAPSVITNQVVKV